MFASHIVRWWFMILWTHFLEFKLRSWMAVRKEFPRIFHLLPPPVPRWQILIDFKNSVEASLENWKGLLTRPAVEGKLGSERRFSFNKLSDLFFSISYSAGCAPAPRTSSTPFVYPSWILKKSARFPRHNQRFKVLLLISLIIIFVCIARDWIDSFINLIPSHVMNRHSFYFLSPLRNGISWPKKFVFVRP